MESITEEILREILLKLPTRDVARCRCVSRQWRGLLTDPSFIDLHVHAPQVVSGSSSVQTLVAMGTRGPRTGLKMVIVDVLSRKRMCSVADLGTRYRPANACNGFLLLAHIAKNKPLYLCNPLTGEKQKIVPPPETEDVYRRTYAMGFSPSSGVYKLFRLCFRASAVLWMSWDNYMDVYTFGGDKGGGSWQRHPHTFSCSTYRLHQVPLVLVDGKLYVLMELLESHHRALELDSMLVIDVESETHGTYHLPENLVGEVTASVLAFDLGGRLCIARRIVSKKLLRFWVLEPLRGQQLDQKKDRSQYGRWELRYTFKVDKCGGIQDEKASGAWLDNADGMLCYRLGDCLYVYDTAKDDERKKTKKVGDLSEWERKIQLPATPSSHEQRWNVYGEYRPSLFSPHDLVSRRNNDELEKYEHDLAQALQCKQ